MSTIPDAPKNLGIIGWDHYEFIVHDLDRSHRFYTRMMDVPQAGRLDDRAAAERGETGLLFRAGKATFACVTPTERNGRAERWLRRHPDGVAVMALRVRDLDHARQMLVARGATFCTGTLDSTDHTGAPYRWFEIATSLGDVRFRFVERGAEGLPPGFVPLADAPHEQNRYGFQVIDHVTSNFLTIAPHIAWLRDVMGMEEYWRVHFHTADVTKRKDFGSGLASIVMWDPESGIKLANNEPVTPNYEASQIYTFVESNHGAGVQHIAFHVPQIIPAVDGLRRGGIEFLQTPATYYDMLPERLVQQKVGTMKEEIETLRRLGILVDGADDRYLLQIFMVEGGVLYDDLHAGPFFYEVIQRCGSRSFGEGNFRALFEAIERDQLSRGVVSSPPSQLDAGAGS